MLRKIKPLEWTDLGDGTHALFIGSTKFGEIIELGSGWIGYFRNSQTVAGETIQEAKAAVEQVFAKWLDTFSEEVKE